MTPLPTETDRTASQIERYIGQHLFDAQGLMYSGIDAQTDQPFDRDFITPIKVPRRADIDPYVLCALAWLGDDAAQEQAVKVVGLRRRVPEDFTAFLSEDYDQLPATVHLYARSVGIGMVGWWRDYWLLRRMATKR